MKFFFNLILICLFIFPSSLIAFGPFPVKGDIENNQKKAIGQAHVYPQYVEIFNKQEKRIGKVGIMVEDGLAKLFLVKEDNSLSLVGYASGGKLYDPENKFLGSYVWTPTWSFIYNKKGKRAGKVKCIAWPRVCAAGVSGYLLGLYGDYHAP